MVVITVLTFYILTYVSIFAFFDRNFFYFAYGLDLVFLADTMLRVSLEVRGASPLESTGLSNILIAQVWRYKQQIQYIVLISPYTFYTWLADAVSILPIERFAVSVFVIQTLLGIMSLNLVSFTDDVARHGQPASPKHIRPLAIQPSIPNPSDFYISWQVLK